MTRVPHCGISGAWHFCRDPHSEEAGASLNPRGKVALGVASLSSQKKPPESMQQERHSTQCLKCGRIYMFVE